MTDIETPIYVHLEKGLVLSLHRFIDTQTRLRDIFQSIPYCSCKHQHAVLISK